jgi:hypothetical protein
MSFVWEMRMACFITGMSSFFIRPMSSVLGQQATVITLFIIKRKFPFGNANGMFYHRDVFLFYTTSVFRFRSVITMFFKALFGGPLRNKVNFHVFFFVFFL